MLLLTSLYILVIALHSNISILFFPTLLEIQDFFETSHYFPSKINISLHFSVGDLLWACSWFSDYSFRVLQFQAFPVSAAEPETMEPFRNYTKNTILQIPTIAPVVQIPTNPDVLRCNHILIELGLSVPMMHLLCFPTFVFHEGLNQATHLINCESKPPG